MDQNRFRLDLSCNGPNFNKYIIQSYSFNEPAITKEITLFPHSKKRIFQESGKFEAEFESRIKITGSIIIRWNREKDPLVPYSMSTVFTNLAQKGYMPNTNDSSTVFVVKGKFNQSVESYDFEDLK